MGQGIWKAEGEAVAPPGHCRLPSPLLSHSSTSSQQSYTSHRPSRLQSWSVAGTDLYLASKQIYFSSFLWS